ncbi:MAG: type II toxin-antitoxin system RelE/ParE family toxin [Acidobacteriota bacterium]|nr:type II toxin-antitoxin system RelE/ParE family toxin [Acidobacteriota bacterium]
MGWVVDLHDKFVAEFNVLPEDVQDELLAHVAVLEVFGPQLGRPRVDTLNGSRHKNMKELRFDAADGVWRFAFAFDPNRRAIVLCGGDKSGGSEKRFYRQLIERADGRFDTHLAIVKKTKTTRGATKKGKQRS